MNKLLIKFLCLIVVLVFLSCGSKVEMQVETYKVKRGDFLSTVTETGELKAVQSQSIFAPRIDYRFGALKVTKIVEDGEMVEAGQTVVEFDKAEVEKGIIDAKAELEIAQAELRKAQAQQVSQIEGLEADFERTRLQYRISQLNLEKATFESEIRRKEIELELDRAAISLEKAKKEIENQKAINKEEISKLQLKAKQVKSRLEEAYETLAKLSVQTPSPGIAIVERNWATDQKIAVDDQLWPGWPIIGLPDLSLMKAEVPVNEVDIAKIDTAQKVFIRMDAFPDTTFHGIVTEMTTLARNKERGSNVKVFDVTVVLDENDAKLMPGMTVSCEIIVERISDTLFVPLEAVFQKEGKDIVYVKKGKSFESRDVIIGQENDNYVIISEGIEENDQVALIDPFIHEEKQAEKEGEKT